MSNSSRIGEFALEQAKAIAIDALRAYPVKVILFGSWAKGTQHQNSDIDIAVEPYRSLPRGVLANLREKFEQSSIPYHVDVMDLSSVTSVLKERIHQEGIEWIDS